MSFGQLPWSEIFVPHHPLEMVIRGFFTYFGLFILLRIILRRQSGQFAMSDILVTVLIADASQNGMAGEYKSIPDGLCLVATILLSDYLVDLLHYRFPSLRRFLEGKPILLISDGKLIKRNLRKELITLEELHSQIREEGIEEVQQVARAFLESNGEITVIKKKKA